MSCESQGAGALDYFPVRYGRSKLLFRGPRRELTGKFCTVIGGTETYGKFVADPYPALTERAIGMPVVNFGYVNAGVDVFLNEQAVLDACKHSRATVIQLVGAHNMSNRFYSVHPRRNDRFLRASSLMKTIFREVDFTEFHFTRHMLATLKAISPEKFAVVEDELKAAWVGRMKQLLGKIEGKTLLVWMSGRTGDAGPSDGMGHEPLLVDDDMVAAVRPHATELVRVVPSAAARSEGVTGMQFTAFEEPVAAEMPGPLFHAEVANAVAPALRGLL